MALTDVRIRRSAKITQTRDSKGAAQLTGSQDFLVISDAANPSFAAILADATEWEKLGQKPLPQVGDLALIGDVEMVCTSRELSYEGDSDRVVVLGVKYATKEPPDDKKPEDTDPETWQRITVASQQITKPAKGWPDLATTPAIGGVDSGKTATNSAKEPVDGLEEESSLVKMTYANTQVPSPNFEQLLLHTNSCNSAAFLGGAEYTVRVAGFSAEYDQKNGTWSVSVEFIYNPDGWKITYYDIGYNENINGERRAITDKAGNPVSKPVPLDLAGGALTIGQEPYELELYPYPKADLGGIFAACGI